jgi:energy-coupling factor transporter ATP-binding protein EcfA2
VKIILLAGSQGSGKTTIANIIRNAAPVACRVLKFADPVYEIHDQARRVLKRYGLDELVGIDRALLQMIGTNWGRNTRSEDLWARCARARALTLVPFPKVVVFDDCRFPNELAAFDDARGVSSIHRIRLFASPAVRRIRAAKWGDPDHQSEVALDGYTQWQAQINTGEVAAEQAARVIMRIADLVH